MPHNAYGEKLIGILFPFQIWVENANARWLDFKKGRGGGRGARKPSRLRITLHPLRQIHTPHTFCWVNSSSWVGRRTAAYCVNVRLKPNACYSRQQNKFRANTSNRHAQMRTSYTTFEQIVLLAWISPRWDHSSVITEHFVKLASND